MRKKSRRSLGWRGGGIEEASHVHWGIWLGPITDIGDQPRHRQVGKDAQRPRVFSSHLLAVWLATPRASPIPVLIAASAGARNTKQTVGRNSESEGNSTGSEQGTNLTSKKNYLWLFI